MRRNNGRESRGPENVCFKAGSRLTNGDKLLGLLVRPHTQPRRVWVDNSVEALQEVVGGSFETLMPFRDAVAVIVHEEGKLAGLPINRLLTDEDGHTVDVILGNMLLLGVEGDGFASLTEHQIQRAERRLTP